MSSFHDVPFVVRLPFGLHVSSQRKVDVVALASGHETRNARTAHTLRRYTVPIGTRPIAEIRSILAFFEARDGPLHAFRFRDPIEHSTAADGGAPSATDAPIGTGDGVASQFQLLTPTGRTIRKPDPASTVVALDGTPVDGADYSIDAATGLIAFNIAPVNGAAITAGCLFDVPVRFRNQSLEITRASAESGALDDLVLLEVIA